jgi:hypothetical protein
VSVFLFCAGVALGILVGRLYSRAKYRYPEFQEMILLKQAQTKTKRMRYEAEQERLRAQIDEILDQRIGS